MAPGRRFTLAAAAAGLVLTVAAPQGWCQGAGYVYNLPLSPLAPQSSAQCAAFASNWERLLDQVNNDHERCLDQNRRAHGQEVPGSGSGPGSLCSFRACQQLHNLKFSLPSRRDADVGDCQRQVSDYQQRQAANAERRAEWAQEQQRLQQAERDRRARQQQAADQARDAAQQQIQATQDAYRASQDRTAAMMDSLRGILLPAQRPVATPANSYRAPEIQTPPPSVLTYPSRPAATSSSGTTLPSADLEDVAGAGSRDLSAFGAAMQGSDGAPPGVLYAQLPRCAVMNQIAPDTRWRTMEKDARQLPIQWRFVACQAGGQTPTVEIIYGFRNTLTRPIHFSWILSTRGIQNCSARRQQEPYTEEERTLRPGQETSGDLASNYLYSPASVFDGTVYYCIKSMAYTDVQDDSRWIVTPE